jgi:hypothetical protein
MIGTVIFRDSTTVTEGGGGTLAGVPVAVQPDAPSKPAAVEQKPASKRTTFGANLAVE